MGRRNLSRPPAHDRRAPSPPPVYGSSDEREKYWTRRGQRACKRQAVVPVSATSPSTGRRGHRPGSVRGAAAIGPAGVGRTSGSGVASPEPMDAAELKAHAADESEQVVARAIVQQARTSIPAARASTHWLARPSGRRCARAGPIPKRPPTRRPQTWARTSDPGAVPSMPSSARLAAAPWCACHCSTAPRAASLRT